MKSEEKDRLLEVCGQNKNSAQHFNQMIWVVFSVGIALSLFILYKSGLIGEVKS